MFSLAWRTSYMLVMTCLRHNPWMECGTTTFGATPFSTSPWNGPLLHLWLLGPQIPRKMSLATSPPHWTSQFWPASRKMTGNLGSLREEEGTKTLKQCSNKCRRDTLPTKANTAPICTNELSPSAPCQTKSGVA